MNALIADITGRDRAYLAELLIAKGYTVYDAFYRTSLVNFWRMQESGFAQQPNLVEFGLADPGSNTWLLQTNGPTKMYNLAVQGSVCVSFKQPRKSTSTGPAPRKCSARCRLCPWTSPRLSIPAACMVSLISSIGMMPNYEETKSAIFWRFPWDDRRGNTL